MHPKLRAIIYIFPLLLMTAAIMSCNKPDTAPQRKPNNPNDSLLLADMYQDAKDATTYSEAIRLAIQARNQAHSLGRDEDEIKSLLLMFDIYYDKGVNQEAFECAIQASELADSLGFKRLAAKAYHDLGNVLIRFKNSPIATKNFANAFYIYFESKDTASAVDVWRDMIKAYYEANLYDSAITVCHRCIFFDKKYHNDRGLAHTFAQYAATELALFRTNPLEPDYSYLMKAHSLFRQAEAINRQSNDPKINKLVVPGLTETLYYKALTEKDNAKRIKLADSSLHYLPQACQIASNTGMPEVSHHINILGLKIHYIDGDMAGTENFVDSLVKIAEKTRSFVDNETAYRAKSILCAYKNDYKGAFENRVLAEKNRDMLNNGGEDYKLALKLAKGQHESEKMKAKAKTAQLEAKARMQRLAILGGTVIITFIIIVVAIVYRSYKRTKKLNAAITEINEEMKIQSDDIRRKTDEILDGITYASIIQTAAMPSPIEMNRIFGEHLTMLSPRNTVSGDFFWASESANGRYKLLVVGDCTGHGVPGALLSMLGMSNLEYITRHFGEGDTTAGTVLDKMRNYFKRTLNQNSFSKDQSIDSIDMALLIFDTKEKLMHYSGAFRPLLIFRYGELMRMKADSMPIGIYPKEKPHFTNNIMSLHRDDVIYLYSDGMTDQDGYGDGTAQAPRAFSSKNLFKLLKEIFRQPFDMQKARLKSALDDWRAPKSATQVQCEQTDDAIIVGIAVKNFMTFESAS